MAEIRLQKWLSQLGIASQKEAEKLVKARKITINGKVVTRPEVKLDPGKDKVRLNGESLSLKRPKLRYWMLCKPSHVITSRKDPRFRMTIYDLPAVRDLGLVFPVGRLDYRTEGLLLLSNDGELVHRLMDPSYKVPRHYYVLIKNRLAPSQEAKIRSGVLLKDGPSLPAKLKYLKEENSGKGVWYQISIVEGRNRIVRRIFKALGHPVIRLIRNGFGEICLPENLTPGQIRPLMQKEILHLKSITALLDP